ncbi:MAG: pyruvate kinase [Pirellulaceae bacterium]|nr:MAG: pyruvate kinase [Pirellulaceae bacterium]
MTHSVPSPDGGYPTHHHYSVRTKIIATVGPASSEPDVMRALVEAGVDVFRINMAHGDRDFHDRMVSQIRQISKQLKRPLAVLVDLAGPKIRLGELAVDPLRCDVGQELEIVRAESAASPNQLPCPIPEVVAELQPGQSIILADGTVLLEVTQRTETVIRARVVSGGIVRSRQGMNLPHTRLSLSALTDEDRRDVQWAATREVDFLGMSFVRSAEDILQLRSLLDSLGSPALIVAKIEKREAMDALESIVSVADAVMVARGDLGVELDIAETPIAQKKIIAACRRYAKPVIVATQMLESMQHSRRPTRAEVSDIANAILDGADACMLSAETAVGDFPVEAVRMMNRVMAVTEQLLLNTPAEPPLPVELTGVHPITSALTYAAGRVAEQIDAALVVIATRSGNTARVKSKQRDLVPTIGVSDSPVALRRMCLYWGIFPLEEAPVNDGPQLRTFIEQWGKTVGLLRPGDRTVFVTGTNFVPVAHNLLVVHEVS